MTSPFEAYAADRTQIERVEDELIWWLMLPKGREYIVGKKGVYHQVGSRRHHYNDPALGKLGLGARVEVRYSDRLPDVIGIFYRGEFLCAAERNDGASRESAKAIAAGRYDRERMVNDVLRKAHREMLADAEVRREQLQPAGSRTNGANRAAKPARRRSTKPSPRLVINDPAVQDLLP